MNAPESADTEAFPALSTEAPTRTNWLCPNCHCDVTSAYCPDCGERPLDPRHLTLRGLIGQLLIYLANLDNRIVNTVRALFVRPGLLTIAFQSGQRQPYIGPFKLFVLANILFFAIQSATDLRVFAMPLEQQLYGETSSEISRPLVSRYLQQRNLRLDEYAPIYDKLVVVHARSLIGLMVLPFSLFLAVIFARANRPFAVHVVFSLHFYAFLLLLYCIPASVIAVSSLLGGPAAISPSVDDFLSIVLMSAVAAYSYIAVHRTYGARGLPRVLETVLLVVVHMVGFLIYRFALLPITLYTS